MLLLVDDQLRVLRAGPQVAALAHRRPEQLPGLSLIAAFGSAALDAVAREAASTGQPASGEAQLGDLARRTGDVDLACRLHQSAVRRVMTLRFPWLASHSLTGLASALLDADDIERALPVLELVAGLNASFAIQPTDAEVTELVLLDERAGRTSSTPFADRGPWEWSTAAEELVASMV